MLYYYRCKGCGLHSPLFLKEEVEEMNPSCIECSKKGESQIELLTMFAFFYGCTKCNGTWKWFSPSDYSQVKAKRPNCPVCTTNEFVYFIPASVKSDQDQLKKRKRPGYLDPEKYDVKLYETVDVTKALLPETKKKKFEPISGVGEKKDGSEEKVLEEFKLEIAESTFALEPVKDDSILRLSRIEGSYKKSRQQRRKVLTKWGALDDNVNPLKTTVPNGRKVSLKRYREDLSNQHKIDGVEFPRLSKSSPTVVNGVKVLPKTTRWDYRELGPNSFLRRISWLLYVVNFGPVIDENDDEKTKKQKKGQQSAVNPIEVQAMWAGGSLYISTNTEKYSTKLLEALTKEKSLKAFIRELKLDEDGTEKYNTLDRNFDSTFLEKLAEYKEACVTNTQESYRSYFSFQWFFVFEQLRDIIEKGTIASVTIERNGKDYRGWTVAPGDRALLKGRVFVVMPGTGSENQGHFGQKKVHAEELFAPILTLLDNGNRLEEMNPAFLGGVKTPCRTCKIVVDDKHQELGKKLVVMTDAFGHYWEASGKHLQKSQRTFDETKETIVFSDNTTSINVFDTECPPSPRSPNINDD